MCGGHVVSHDDHDHAGNEKVIKTIKQKNPNMANILEEVPMTQDVADLIWCECNRGTSRERNAGIKMISRLRGYKKRK
jgi:beta-lactamase superfamily II metal-dependent hydrolase